MHFTVTFAAEVGHLWITVNAVDPGPTDSGWRNEGIRAELVPRFGLGRIGLPADAANLLDFSQVRKPTGLPDRCYTLAGVRVMNPAL
jgi:NAD(P)-dependent dehydrogenase (short-subunit alcohol dehydrogenase family)